MYKEYAFIFDPAESFQYMYEFESKLDEFFSMSGYEVEKTPAYDMDTLFVVGCQPLEEVLEQGGHEKVADKNRKNEIPHERLSGAGEFIRCSAV